MASYDPGGTNFPPSGSGFPQGPYGPGSGWPQYPGGGSFGPPPPPRKSGRSWLWVAVALGICCVVCCGICGGGGWIATNYVFNQKAEELKTLYGDHPMVRDKLGGLEECSVDLSASGDAPQDVFVYNVRGPKGTGQLWVTEDDDSAPASVKLRTPEGEWELAGEIDLFGQGSPLLPKPLRHPKP